MRPEVLGYFQIKLIIKTLVCWEFLLKLQAFWRKCSLQVNLMNLKLFTVSLYVEVLLKGILVRFCFEAVDFP